MIEIRPFSPCPPPDDSAGTLAVWHMAEVGAGQHTLNVRMAWQGNQLVALGGVVALVPADGLAFAWWRGLNRFAWRHLLPALRAGIWGAHERGMRRISALVAAVYAPGIRLLKHLDFGFVAAEFGYAGEKVPMLRYEHTWPAFEVPVLVAWQQRELERAAHTVWCPEVV